MRHISLAPMLALLAALVSSDPVPAQTTAAPTQLPVAERQLPRWDQYFDLLNVIGQPAGYSYPDPVTGVRVTKVTSAIVPTSNPGVAVEYSEGGPYVSGEWGTGQHTILIRTGEPRPWLVDYQRGGGVSNWRQFPLDVDGNGIQGPYPRYGQTSSFSNDPATPHILYFVDYDRGATTFAEAARTTMKLYRFNTQSGLLESDGGHIPITGREIPGTAGDPTRNPTFTKLDWMQSSKDDKWFVFQWCVLDDTTNSCVVKRVVALDRLGPNDLTNPLYRTCIEGDNKLFDCVDRTGPLGVPDGLLDSSDLDEPHLDRDGNYVVLLDGTKLPVSSGQEQPACAGGSTMRACSNALATTCTTDADCPTGGTCLFRVFNERYWHLWNLNTDLHECKENIYAAHTGWVRGHFANHDGDDTPSWNFYYSATTGTTTNTTQYDDPKAFHASHRAGQWIQTSTDATQWSWGSNYADGEVKAGAWERLAEPRFVGDVDYANVFVTIAGDCDERRDPADPARFVELGVICWTPQYLKPNIGIQAVYQSGAGIPLDDENRLRYNLAKVGSIAEVTHGSFHYDGDNQLLYVWSFGNVEPKSADNYSRIFMFAPTPVHRGVGLRRLNGSDVRLLCHNYSWSGRFDGDVQAWVDDYVETPFANTSPDGKVVIFTSNMGKRDGTGARTDVFIAEVPVASGGGGGGCGPGSAGAGPPVEC